MPRCTEEIKWPRTQRVVCPLYHLEVVATGHKVGPTVGRTADPGAGLAVRHGPVHGVAPGPVGHAVGIHGQVGQVGQGPVTECPILGIMWMRASRNSMNLGIIRLKRTLQLNPMNVNILIMVTMVIMGNHQNREY